MRRLSTLLRDLSEGHPRLAAHLSQAQSNRQLRLLQYLDGDRLRGYEELIDHLEQLEITFQQSRRLQPLSLLIRRVRNDYHTAMEATISGFHAVAYDAMREVMEVEFLLREFNHDAARIEEWLQATPQELRDKFQPGVLRSRHANRLGIQPRELPESADYRGHSMLIHVLPYENPVGGSGLAQQEDPFIVDSCFWDMFEHARRMLIQAHCLRRKLARHIKSPWGPERGMKQFRRAWTSTQMMQKIWMALLENPPGDHDDDGA